MCYYKFSRLLAPAAAPHAAAMQLVGGVRPQQRLLLRGRHRRRPARAGPAAGRGGPVGVHWTLAVPGPPARRRPWRKGDVLLQCGLGAARSQSRS